MDGELKFKTKQTDEAQASGAPLLPSPSPTTTAEKAEVRKHHAYLHWDEPLIVTVMLRQAISHPASSPVTSKAQRDASKQHLVGSLPEACLAMPAEAMPFYEPSVATPAPGLRPSSARHPGSEYCPDVAMTLSVQRDHRRQHTPYSRDSISVGVSARTSAEYTDSQASFATVFPKGYAFDGPHRAWPPVAINTHAVFAGAGYANNDVYAQVVDGRIIPPLPVPHFNAPADNWKVHAPLVDSYEAPSGNAHGPIVDVHRQRYAESFSVTYPVPAPLGLKSRLGHNLEDEIFDIEALERSLANSPTSSTSSSSSGAVVNSYDASGWASHARSLSALPSQYSGADFVAVCGWSGAPEPEVNTIWHENPAAYCTASGAPTVHSLAGTPIVDAIDNSFAGSAFTEPLLDQMSADDIFQGCFDECKPLWLPESSASGDKFYIGEPNDFAYFAQSSTHSIPHQLLTPTWGERFTHTVYPYPLSED